jgi:hypothetical protein
MTENRLSIVGASPVIAPRKRKAGPWEKNAKPEKNFARNVELLLWRFRYLYDISQIICAAAASGAGIGKAVDRFAWSPYNAFIDGGAASERRMRSLLRL